MDDLMSRVLVNKYRDVFVSGAVVDIAVGHFGIADRAIHALKALHPGLRVGAISRNRGLMWLDVGYDTAVYPEDIIDSILGIVTDARTLSAWTCAKDGRPGWLVDGPKGQTVLCPGCQRDLGLEVRRHEA
ncbi:hypothetical protein [Neorhizobium tomejilense]|uniref:hypothetical protein n=1 Tax=Neorhizobium tomejilense TaxID=2093828 RepID=UPI003ED035E3